MDKLLSKLKWKVIAPLLRRVGIGDASLKKVVLPPSIRGPLRGRFFVKKMGEFAAKQGYAIVKAEGPFANARNIGLIFESIATLESVDAAEKWLHGMREKYPEFSERIKWAPVHGCFNIDTERALAIAEDLLKELSPEDDQKYMRFVASKYQDAGYLQRPIEILAQIPNDVYSKRALKLAVARKKLLDEGFPLPKKSSVRAYEPVPRTSLYLLHNSLPFASGGYATRTHGLAVGAARNNWTVEGLTRLGFPKDVDEKRGWQIPAVSDIEGIRYHRALDSGNPYRELDSHEYLLENAEHVERIAQRLKPAIIHGASNHINGISGNHAARNLGVKSVFEVRGLWELTRMSRQPSYFQSEAYQQVMRLETEAAQNADAVITITEALKQLMIDRGVPDERIRVIPNGVDCSRFHPLEKDSKLVKEYNLEGKTVIGFVGSMPQYEGLDDLLRALQIIRQRGRDDFHFLAVGDGDEFVHLQAMLGDMRLSEHVTFTGRVPHSEVERYYSVIDVAPFPRKRQPVCEVVSPLKPFEAMAMAKAVLVSDVAALKEIVVDDVRGLHFEADSPESIAETILRVMDDIDLRKRLGLAGLEWVREERDWAVLSQRLVNLYESLT